MSEIVDFAESILKDLKEGPISATSLAKKFGIEKIKVVAVLNDLRKQGKVSCSGRGRGATWSGEEG